MRRFLLACFAFGLAACEASNTAPEPAAETSNAAVTYTLEVRADENAQLFMVSGSDGKSVAGRAENGVSTLMSDEEAQTFLAAAAPIEGPQGGDKVTFKVPGLSIEAAGDDAEGGAGKVKLEIGGRSIDVAADGSDSDKNAHVRIGGASADEARKFIDDAEKLSPEVKTQMREQLGL